MAACAEHVVPGGKGTAGLSRGIRKDSSALGGHQFALITVGVSCYGNSDAMKTSQAVLVTSPFLLLLAAAVACGRAEPPAPAAHPAPAPANPTPPIPAVGLYVTNETSGDLTVIDAA